MWQEPEGSLQLLRSLWLIATIKPQRPKFCQQLCELERGAQAPTEKTAPADNIFAALGDLSRGPSSSCLDAQRTETVI